MKTSELHTLRSILTEGIKIEGHYAPVEISCIYIPKIQRAYAQGRNKESDVRKDFLDALFGVLTSPEERSVELGFLFGSKQIVAKKSAEGFELLDGQQRATTLFLLYWYVSMNERNCVPEFFSKFTYETRDTSTQFLSNITARNFKVSIRGSKPSVAIKSNKWFTDDYYCDPTVCAMLTMLDSIDELYQKYHCDNVFDNLERLKFYVLMLEKFDMNDELYIKMNSRGLSLTPFENFKASIVQFMKSEQRKGLFGTDKVENDRPPFWFTFISDMDAKWIDIFWKYDPSEEEKRQECNDIIEIDDRMIGNRYFSFINRYLFTKAALADNLSNSRINSLTSFFYKDAESEKMKSRLFGWENYEKIFRQNEESAQLKDSLFYQMQKVLDTFHAHKDYIEKSIQSDPFGRTTGFRTDTDRFNNFHERVAFAAVTEFIENIPETSSFDDEIVQTNFKRMLRVAFNIIENTLIESPEAAVRIIKIFHAMNSAAGAISDNFYRSLATATFQSDNRQLQEEILKAKEMFSNNEYIDFIPEWEKAFTVAEHHPFFKGSVRFFFTEKSGTSDAFIARYNVIKDLFDKDGITEEYRKDHILLRAVLSRLNTWRTLGNRYFTEDAEREKYLKNIIIGQDEVRKLFCNYFDLNTAKPVAEYLVDVISDASPQENESQGFKMLFNRLVKDPRSVPLLDWVHKREIAQGKMFYIQENRSSLVINIPGKWYDRMLLDTERDKIIPVLADKYHMEYDDSNQKKMMRSPIGDSFGWSISIKKQIECKSVRYNIKVTFNEWKWVDFYIYGQNIEQLASMFDVPVEKRYKDYIQLSPVQYCMLKDMQYIDEEIERIIKVLEE